MATWLLQESCLHTFQLLYNLPHNAVVARERGGREILLAIIMNQRQLEHHFRVGKQIGRGAYGIAYQVERLEDGKLYALKQTDIKSLPAHVAQDVVNEVRLLASLRHPHIVRFHEAFLVEGSRLCVVMELLHSDLASVIKSHKDARKSIPEDVIWSYFLQVGEGLRYLHSRNIMHRDVKPHNILVSADGVVKLVDLGIAKLMRETLTRTLIGTPSYMSPEVWERQPYEFGCDVWSLGCLLFEMAALEPPFQGSSMRELRIQVLMGRLQRIPEGYSDDLWLLIRSMLTSQPHLRPSMEELMQHYTVQERRHLLPHAAVAACAADADLSPRWHPSMLDTIRLPNCWDDLNLHLPPASYSVGSGVLDQLLQQGGAQGPSDKQLSLWEPPSPTTSQALSQLSMELGACGLKAPPPSRTGSYAIAVDATRLGLEWPPLEPASPHSPQVVELHVRAPAQLSSPGSSGLAAPQSPAAEPRTFVRSRSQPASCSSSFSAAAALMSIQPSAAAAQQSTAAVAEAAGSPAAVPAWAPLPPVPTPAKLHPKYAALVSRDMSAHGSGAAAAALAASSNLPPTLAVDRRATPCPLPRPPSHARSPSEGCAPPKAARAVDSDGMRHYSLDSSRAKGTSAGQDPNAVQASRAGRPASASKRPPFLRVPSFLRRRRVSTSAAAALQAEGGSVRAGSERWAGEPSLRDWAAAAAQQEGGRRGGASQSQAAEVGAGSLGRGLARLFKLRRGSEGGARM